MTQRTYILLLFLFLTFNLRANTPAVDTIASTRSDDTQAEPDRPGMGTGTTVLPWGFIQWETGFEVAHFIGTHTLALPTTLFRFGLGPIAELRLEYTGELVIEDPSQATPMTDVFYVPEPLWIGTKIRLWQGSDEPKLKWIPRTSLMLNAGLPLTTFNARYYPFSGAIDLLFENDIADWLSIGYDLGVYWLDWAPTPDIFASLAFNFMPTDKLGIFIESYNSFDTDAFDPLTDPPQKYTVYNINLDFGLTYRVHPHVQLDAYSGFNLYHSESSLSGPRNNVYIGLGVTWLLYTH